MNEITIKEIFTNERGGILYSPLNIEITQRVNAIEGLKSQLLNDVAQLYSVMTDTKGVPKDQYLDLFVDIMILTYLLGGEMGISYEEIDRGVKCKLKENLIEGRDKEKWVSDLQELLRHFS